MSEELKKTDAPMIVHIQCGKPEADHEEAQEYAGGTLKAKVMLVDWLHSKLSNGNEVFTAMYSPEHPQGGQGVHHEFYATDPDGQRTRLAFALTQEACQALVAQYVAHGVVRSTVTFVPEGKQQEGADS